ncbi:cell envelope integrity protein TolA [Sulfurimonas sp.]|uniref:cell envelope integrity protein TolA n=1 Tax=Sulfurimonas sp. TaxID=2022749 RepID=UPI002AAF41E4|nr:TonB C-terminal domain-containing protein [Sulfurimonas sp.]
MANNNSYFYISGLISISLFSFFSFIVFFMMVSTSKVNIFALKKDTFITISLELPDIQTKAAQSLSEPKDVNIDDLFNDVWTKKINKKKKVEKKVDNKRLTDISKKSKKIKVTNEKNIQKSIEITKDNELKKSSTADEVNEYLAKIQALVYQNFIPPPNSQGHSVKAVIELTSLGKLIDFRILVYSENSSLNDECDKIKERLRVVLFPTNIQNQSFRATINLIPENKEKF